MNISDHNGQVLRPVSHNLNYQVHIQHRSKQKIQKYSNNISTLRESSLPPIDGTENFNPAELYYDYFPPAKGRNNNRLLKSFNKTESTKNDSKAHDSSNYSTRDATLCLNSTKSKTSGITPIKMSYMISPATTSLSKYRFKSQGTKQSSVNQSINNSNNRTIDINAHQKQRKRIIFTLYGKNNGENQRSNRHTRKNAIVKPLKTHMFGYKPSIGTYLDKPSLITLKMFF